ncbi:ACT domain-containing protein [Candidatus Micrarchaeota archaeon]|nr:ACT domain-containing protein [Candidatus Micrarchaeota archaeon]
MLEKELVVLTAFGKDKTGLVAGITKILAENKVNIEDLSQTIMQDMFAMLMLLDISESGIDFETLQKKLDEEGNKLGLQVKIQHKNIFESMHRV